MCIICISPSKVRQPDLHTLATMFYMNPHGAGYMYARNGKVHIRKGFMDFASFHTAVRRERFTAEDSVVYHFRISTQAGVQPQMTHPFPLSNQGPRLRALRESCRFGIAHNGVIQLTADPNNKQYSDTAIFIANYLTDLIKRQADLHDPKLLNQIHELAQSKLAIMDATGYVATVGKFINDHGLLFSNTSYRPFRLAR